MSEMPPTVYFRLRKEVRRTVKGYASYSDHGRWDAITGEEIHCLWRGDGPHPDAEQTVYFERLYDYLLQIKLNEPDYSFMVPHVGSLPDGKIIFYMGINKPFVQRLCEILPSPVMRLRGSIEFGFPSRRSHGNNRVLFDDCLQLKDLLKSADELGSGRIRPRITCATEEPYVPSASGSIDLTLKFDVILGWSDIDPNGVKIRSNCFLQSLYGMDDFKDVTIVSRDGVEVKCHRSVIAAHSPVLAAMLSMETGMIESRTGRIVMPENSKEGIHHLLRYFYGFEIINAELLPVAAELFKTAHMYELAQLEKHLGDLILKNAKESFSPDAILGLYFHAKNIGLLEAFRCNLLCIMKSMQKELRACEGYHGLNPEQRESLILELFDANGPTPKNRNE